MDLLASFASLLNQSIPKALDSENTLSAFLGKSSIGRDELIIEACSKLAYRTGDWALIPPYDGNAKNESGNEIGNLSEYTLFNLKTDIGQTLNQSKSESVRFKKLKARFELLTKGYLNDKVKDIPLQ
jgi:hypothetical protein